MLISPILGFVLALLLFRLIKLVVHDKHLYEPPEKDEPPVWWMRAILIATCTGVSFAHGTNDGQKSIGLIMLTIIGLLPAAYALNMTMTSDQLAGDARAMPVDGQPHRALRRRPEGAGRPRGTPPRRGVRAG